MSIPRRILLALVVGWLHPKYSIALMSGAIWIHVDQFPQAIALGLVLVSVFLLARVQTEVEHEMSNPRRSP